MQERLIQNIIDQIKEAQLKLGYAKETVRLYYPAASICGLLGVSFEKPAELLSHLKEDSALQKSPLGPLAFSLHGGRIEISIPPEGAEYVFEKVPEPAFLKDIIQLFEKNHHCTLEDIRRVFRKYSEDFTCEKMPEGMDFDYALYFDNEKIDSYYYCIKEEMGHTIYHRFTKEDYFLLLA